MRFSFVIVVNKFLVLSPPTVTDELIPDNKSNQVVGELDLIAVGVDFVLT